MSSTRDLAETISDIDPTSLDDSYACLFDLLVRVEPHGLVIIEDDVRLPDDRAVAGLPHEQVAGYGTTLFHLRQITDLASSDDLKGFVGRSSFGYPLNGLVTRGQSIDVARSQIKKGELESLIEHRQLTIHSAHDGDAIAVWIPEAAGVR